MVQVAAQRGFIRECLTHIATFAVIKSILEHYQPIVSCRKDLFHCNLSRTMSPLKILCNSRNNFGITVFLTA